MQIGGVKRGRKISGANFIKTMHASRLGSKPPRDKTRTSRLDLLSRRKTNFQVLFGYFGICSCPLSEMRWFVRRRAN